MRTYVLCAVAGFILLTPSLVAQTSAAAPVPIPEEARRHFVMGETMFKEAKNVDAFTQAVAEFTEAARLAPQWPDARYDLALAKEAAGDFAGAMADLKLYQQFKLTDAEARTAQDKIYAIEAKQKLQASNTAARLAAAAASVQAQADAHAAAHQDTVQFLQGEWNGSIFDAATARAGFGGRARDTVHITITGEEVLIDLGNLYTDTSVKGTITGDDLSSIKWFAHDLSRGSHRSDRPIMLTINKTASQIHFSLSGGEYGNGEADVNLTR